MCFYVTCIFGSCRGGRISAVLASDLRLRRTHRFVLCGTLHLAWSGRERARVAFARAPSLALIAAGSSPYYRHTRTPTRGGRSSGVPARNQIAGKKTMGRFCPVRQRLCVQRLSSRMTIELAAPASITRLHQCTREAVFLSLHVLLFSVLLCCCALELCERVPLPVYDLRMMLPAIKPCRVR